MAMEGACRRKLAELMTDHVFSAVNRDELVTVMHRKRKSDHLGHNHRASRPGPNNPLVSGAVGRLYFFLQMSIEEWTFFQRPRHLLFTDLGFAGARLSPLELYRPRPYYPSSPISQLRLPRGRRVTM